MLQTLKLSVRRFAHASGMAILLSACSPHRAALEVAISAAAVRIAESSARAPGVAWERLAELAQGIGARITACGDGRQARHVVIPAVPVRCLRILARKAVVCKP